MTSFLVIDNTGIFTEHASGLSKGGKNKVWYFCDWQTSFPMYTNYIPGYGLPGLEKVYDVGPYIDKADVVVNFDVNGNDLIGYLREHGKACFGSGKGHIIEDERELLKKTLEESGLAVQKYAVVKGIDKLREYLKDNSKQFVKIDRFRGEFESFYARNLKSVEVIIQGMEKSAGPMKNDLTFVVEEKIDCSTEYGVDGFTNSLDYIRPFLLGIEYQKSCYFARITDELPPQLEETMTKLKPMFKKYDWRGAFSTEEMIIDKKKHFFLDICARYFHPGSVLYTEAIRNYPEVIEAIAKRKMVRLDIKEKYWAAVPLDTGHAQDNWTYIDVKPEDRKFIKLGLGIQKGNEHYVAPSHNANMCVAAVIIAGGNSIDQVCTTLKERAEKVHAYGLGTTILNDLDKINSIADAGRKIGVDF